jgi:nitrogen fixation/metabolism regulation signal transduction histidine kinase
MRKPFGIFSAITLLSLVLLTSLMMMSNATQNSTRFGHLYSVLLFVNALGLVTFIVLIGVQVHRLMKALRERRPGSRLTLRMLTLFVGLSVVPLLVVYGFSLDFLRRGIDSWFDLRIEQALTDSLELSRSALDQRMRGLLKQTAQLAAELAEDTITTAPLNLEELQYPNSPTAGNGVLPVDLDELRDEVRADELLLLTNKGKIIDSSSVGHDVVPNLPGEGILLQLRQGQNYIGLDPIRGAKLAIRVVVRVPDIASGEDGRILQAIFPIATRMNQLADNVQSAFAKYKELAYLREPLKVSFMITLTLVLLLSIFSAVWAAFYFAGHLSEPISNLAEGTQAVARGDYRRELPVTSQDDVGFLVESFNEMTRQIAQAQDETQQSRDQVEAQRAYLETILSRLSSGVLTLNRRQRLRTGNPSASKILGIDLQPFLGKKLESLSAQYPYLQPLVDAIRAGLTGPTADWGEQVAFFGASGRQVLMCRGATLPTTAHAQAGHVIVFDDITAILQGQREAAWSEVARRLAHEIKNPLTPIQLSTERMRHKYLKSLPAKDAETMDRLTNTIIQQVETMKGMVNTFSEYARTPQLQPQSLNMGKLVEEVLDLYRSVDRKAAFETRFESDTPSIEADPSRMRQVLNNLVKNAIEATEEGQSPHITITTRRLAEANHQYLELRVADRGRGIPESMLGQIFEPYVTNKQKGTGLGLAIVKKIIEEHGGVVWLENNTDGPGATVVIRLPLNGREAVATSPQSISPEPIRRSVL